MTNIVELSGRDKSKLIQFAIDLSKVKTEKLKFPMWISEKYDGVYCLALKHEGTVTIYSRTGEVYVSMDHIATELSKIMCNDDIIIFEAYAAVVQSTISGWCRDTKAQHEVLCAYCHTMISLDEFIHGGVVPFATNNEILRRAIVSLDSTSVNYVAQISVDSIDKAMEIAQRIWERGGEGAVLRDPSAKFQGGK
jgi:ATP-dependent DNA ligase